MLELAEEQPQRGHFESERLLRVLLEGPAGLGRRFARQVPFLITQGDLVRADDGSLAVEGWEILQEGDTTIAERVVRFRSRKRLDPESRDPLTGAQRTALYRLRQRVFERDAYTCRYCGTADSPREWLVADHVVPNGPTTEDNLATACRSCNKLKGGQAPDEAGMSLRDVTPCDGDVTLQPDVTQDTVTLHPETVTPRAGRDARDATRAQRRGDGYQATDSVDGEGDVARARRGASLVTRHGRGADPSDTIAAVLGWLARERSASVPEGAGLIELARLVDQHGVPAVIGALGELDPAMKDGRQYVFGAMKRLNPLPGGRNGKSPGEYRPSPEEAADAFERF
ncbi:MAG TPA: HNH endonuclease signature motif containing protein [Patescibacteria group bacterium]|nr:HNH endonuclease signature motif containing protein [Patescibacteria group bacterium]